MAKRWLSVADGKNTAAVDGLCKASKVAEIWITASVICFDNWSLRCTADVLGESCKVCDTTVGDQRH